MSVKDNTRWLTFKIERELGKEIDRFVSKVPKRYGSKKYLSRSDFVKRACVLLLEREQKEVIAR